MKFAELSKGMRFKLGPVTVDEREIVEFASHYDDQWFHTDPAKAACGPFEGLIASGWHTCALAMRLVSRGPLAGSESYASPGVKQIRWPHPVRPGDVLTLEIVVHDSRRSVSKPELGIVEWQWMMSNQDGRLVLDLHVTSMFDLSEAPR